MMMVVRRSFDPSPERERGVIHRPRRLRSGP